jgi:hypothetical protein
VFTVQDPATFAGPANRTKPAGATVTAPDPSGVPGFHKFTNPCSTVTGALIAEFPNNTAVPEPTFTTPGVVPAKSPNTRRSLVL